MASMNAETEFDVVIIGCGLVGAAMALALKQTGLRVAVADRQAFDAAKATHVSEPERFDPRVSALTVGSQQFLDGLGTWQSIEAARCCAYSDMHVWDGEGTGSIHFNAKDISQAHLGTIVENSVVLSALTEQLQQDSSITRLIPFTIENMESNPSGVTLHSAEGQQIDTKLVIGADGANSRVRELMHFTTKEWDYQHTAIVTTVKTELSHQNTAWQRFMTSGPLAFLPLSGDSEQAQQYCSIVWSIVPERANELMALDDTDFCQELGRAFEHRLGEVSWCDKRFQLPLRQRHSTEYFKQHVALVGDAAHTIHPLAGQGVNLGFQDAEALANEIKNGLASGRAVNDPVVLARYQRKRSGHNLGMMWLMEGFKHLFAEQAPPIQWLRNIGLNAVDSLSIVKNQLARRAMGLD